MLELKLLGVPEVRLDGHVHTLRRRGSIGLLAYLALSHRAHAREALATLLAGDNPEATARKFLSNLLVDLHSQVGQYIVTTRQFVGFDRGRPYTLDVAEFQSKAAACDPASSLEDLQAAIDLYEGEFLEGLSQGAGSDFDAWQSAQREELRSTYMHLLRAHLEASIKQAAWERGIRSARRLLTQEPWQEETHRDLMFMLARSAQHQAAMAQYHVCRRTLREELGVEPSSETVALFNRLRGATVRPPHNLPNSTSHFVGRGPQVEQLSTLLTDPECQLVTITGLTGSGKTRLALHVAFRFAADSTPPPEQPFPDGIFRVDLDGVASSAPTCKPSTSEATHALATALEAVLPNAPSAGDTWPRLCAHLADQAMLLVLDHFDQVGPAAAVLPGLLARAPHLKLLVTSRVPLQVEGEHVLHLDGLGLPTAPEEVESAEASALFLQEARRVSVAYQLPDSERAPLVRLCGRLGGFPLAMLLAARWATLLSCSAMLAELESGAGLDVLTTSDADVPERHRSMTGVLDGVLADLLNEGLSAKEMHAIASEFPCAPFGANRRNTLHEFIPALKLMERYGLLRVDPEHGRLELHPLMGSYARAEQNGASRLSWGNTGRSRDPVLDGPLDLANASRARHSARRSVSRV